MRLSRSIQCLALAVELVASGCAWVPEDGKRAELLPMPAISETLAEDAPAAGTTNGWPRADWWTSFRSAELNRLITTALRDSPSLRAASARLAQAEAVADYQAAEMLPSIGASAVMTHRRFSAHDFYGPNGGRTFTGAYLDFAEFSYHLDLWGKDRALLDSALGTARAQASELAMAKLLLAAAIARSYFRLRSAEEETGLAGQAVAQAEERLHLAQLRWNRGIDVQDPVHLGEATLEASRQCLVALQTEVRVLRHRLAALAGQGPDWGRSIAVSNPSVAEHFPLPEKLPLELLAHRPDVVAALWRVEAAARLVKVAKTKFYPDVDLVGFAGLRALNLKDLFLSHGSSLAYSIGPSVTLPVFEGGRLEADLKNEQAGYDAAVETYNSTLLGAVQQVADALAYWQRSEADDATQERAVRAAEAEAGLAAKRYRAGLSARDGEIDADDALIDQRLKLSGLESERLQAAVGLIEALGGGYLSDAAATEAQPGRDTAAFRDRGNP